MNDKMLIDYINNEVENEFIDFKIIQYNWSDLDDKEDFLIDIISMANSNYIGDKYIITGVKVKPDGERIIKGIDISSVIDSANYQQLVTENIEPSLNVVFKTLDYDNKKFGIFKISECNDRPYMLKKKYGKYENGYLKVRKGSRNTNISRYILDSIYKSKIPNEISEFKISGLIDGNVADDVILNKFDFFPNLEKEREKLLYLFKKINKFKIDDIEESNIQLPNSLNFLKEGLFPTEPIRFEEEITENIKQFANIMEEQMNDDFFEIGNTSKKFNGLTSGYYGPYADYKYIGSDKSLQKYNMILQLDKDIKKFIGWASFLDKVKDIKYIQLAITEIGNIADEEIQVNLEIPTEAYISIEEFPHASIEIEEELSEQYSNKMFMPYYNNTISDYRKMPMSTSTHISIPTSNPFISEKFKMIDNIYDFIDYDEIQNREKTIISFTIKNIKVGETMIFPGNIFLKNKISKIPYSIISKKSNKKMDGEIIVKV